MMAEASSGYTAAQLITVAVNGSGPYHEVAKQLTAQATVFSDIEDLLRERAQVTESTMQGNSGEAMVASVTQPKKSAIELQDSTVKRQQSMLETASVYDSVAPQMVSIPPTKPSNNFWNMITPGPTDLDTERSSFDSGDHTNDILMERHETGVTTASSTVPSSYTGVQDSGGNVTIQPSSAGGGVGGTSSHHVSGPGSTSTGGSSSTGGGTTGGGYVAPTGTSGVTSSRPTAPRYGQPGYVDPRQGGNTGGTGTSGSAGNSGNTGGTSVSGVDASGTGVGGQITGYNSDGTPIYGTGGSGDMGGSGSKNRNFGGQSNLPGWGGGTGAFKNGVDANGNPLADGQKLGYVQQDGKTVSTATGQAQTAAQKVAQGQNGMPGGGGGKKGGQKEERHSDKYYQKEALQVHNDDYYEDEDSEYGRAYEWRVLVNGARKYGKLGLNLEMQRIEHKKRGWSGWDLPDEEFLNWKY
jgi:hypothetical protein